MLNGKLSKVMMHSYVLYSKCVCMYVCVCISEIGTFKWISQNIRMVII